MFVIDKRTVIQRYNMYSQMQILKYEEPEPTSEEDDDDHDINKLNKRIERQESNISNTLSNSGNYIIQLLIYR